MFGGVVAAGDEMREKGLIGDSSCLRQSVHTFTDFRQEASIVNKWLEMVLLDDVVWDHRVLDPHILVVR